MNYQQLKKDHDYLDGRAACVELTLHALISYLAQHGEIDIEWVINDLPNSLAKIPEDEGSEFSESYIEGFNDHTKLIRSLLSSGTLSHNP